MPVAGEGDDDEYLALLTQIADPVATVAPERQALIRRFVDDLETLSEVTRDTLAQLIRDEPEYVPVLASVVGLTRERLKRQLQHHTGSAAWSTRASQDPGALISMLDDEFQVVERTREARGRTYTLSDVLIARAGTRAGAGGAIDAGRYLEDSVEAIISGLGLPFETRTRFQGRGGQDAPADFAIPNGGQGTLIAVAVKGFESTGSKLTDAVGEIRRMAEVRTPTQFVFAVVDGLGWTGRTSDLSRIIDMVRSSQIDGVFPMQQFGQFENALHEAAVRLRLLAP